MSDLSGRQILFLLPSISIGGAERAFAQLASRFLAEGAMVSLISLANETDRLQVEFSEEVNLICFRPVTRFKIYVLNRLVMLFMSIWRTGMYLRKNNPDLVMSSVKGANIVAVMASQLFGFSGVVVVRESSAFSFERPVIQKLFTWLYGKADLVITVSSEAGKKMLAVDPGMASKVVSLQNPLDVKRLQHMASKDIPDHPWLSSDATIPILCVGRLVQEKNYSSLITVLATLIAKNSDVRLIFVGDGQLRASLQRQFNDSGLAEFVDFVGETDNPWVWMANARVIAMPSVSEGFPNVLREALVLGVPVVANRFNSDLQDYEDCQLLALADAADSGAFADTLLTVINGPGTDLTGSSELIDDLNGEDAYLRAVKSLLTENGADTSAAGADSN